MYQTRKMYQAVIGALCVASIIPQSMAGAENVPQVGTGKGKVSVGPLTGTYLLELCDLKAEVGKAEATAMETLFASIAASTDKQVSDALRDLPKLAAAAGKNKTTYSGYAGKFRAIYRATVVKGGNAWAKGLGRDAAAQAATAILVEAKVMPNGRPRLDKEERAEKREDAKVLAQVERASIIARKAGDRPGGPNWDAHMVSAQLQLDTEWADKTARDVAASITQQQLTCYITALQTHVKATEAEQPKGKRKAA